MTQKISTLSMTEYWFYFIFFFYNMLFFFFPLASPKIRTTLSTCMKFTTLASMLQGHTDKLAASKCNSFLITRPSKAETLIGISLDGTYLSSQILCFIV